MTDIRWEITVATLRAALEGLEPDDLLVPNEVRNLAVIRPGEDGAAYIGYINISTVEPGLELFDEEAPT